jgi:hypothetical protein
VNLRGEDGNNRDESQPSWLEALSIPLSKKYLSISIGY